MDKVKPNGRMLILKQVAGHLYTLKIHMKKETKSFPLESLFLSQLHLLPHLSSKQPLFSQLSNMIN